MTDRDRLAQLLDDARYCLVHEDVEAAEHFVTLAEQLAERIGL